MTDSCIYLDTYVLQQDMRVRDVYKRQLLAMWTFPGKWSVVSGCWTAPCWW